MKPKLRDSRHLIDNLYNIGDFPEDVITDIGASIVYLAYTGRKDMTGNDWGDIFAEAIGGHHLSSPVGIADVVKDRLAWSLKTVKAANPFKASNARIISGRCSPDYSYGILDPHEDIQKTGEAVLAIWNSRVDIAMSHYSILRECILIRNNDLTEFSIYENYLEHAKISDFVWEENKNGNLEGINRYTGMRSFVWQPHGAQFTVLEKVPSNALHFKLRHPPRLDKKDCLDAIGFNPSWVEIISRNNK